MMSIGASRRLKTGIAILIAVPFVVPFVLLISTALRDRVDYIASPGGLPRSFTLDNLVVAWNEANLGRALVSTLIVCAVACAVCGITALAAAYWFRIHRGRLVGALRWVLVAGYAIPMIAWLIPVFVILANGGLTDNLVVAGVVNGVASLPFALYLVHTFFGQVLTAEMLEAATLDGAGVFRTFWNLAVPLSKPAMASVFALVFVWTFGDLLVAATLLQGDESVYTITLAATSLSTREDVNLQGQAAAAVVALLPTLVVFAVAQRALAKGFGGVSDK
ncbi:carbohydrate ABC transporter permease [Agromyces sp. NPDC058484]|uniref:carbohydrate ABC transporter permease n=1 Tax=Agromyces sp. NPDC058484 TaxID=3346524 RepID=UPI00364FA987